MINLSQLIKTTWDYNEIKSLGFFREKEVNTNYFVALDVDVFYQRSLEYDIPMSIEEMSEVPHSKFVKKCNLSERWVEFLDGHREDYNGKLLLISKTGEDIVIINRNGIIIKGINIGEN